MKRDGNGEMKNGHRAAGVCEKQKGERTADGEGVLVSAAMETEINRERGER